MQFNQPDTVIPDLNNSQDWNRYAYARGNPLNYTDPTGHWPWPPPGNQIQINLALGLNVGPAFLLYGSLSLVTDDEGGVQIYYTKRDQDFEEGTSGQMGGFDAGSTEENYPTEMLAVGGVSVSYGLIYGSKFEEEGTLAYRDGAVDGALGVGPVSLDAYATFDTNSETIDPSSLLGFDVGVGFGGPLTIGTVSTKAIPLTSRIQLPPFLIPSCKSIGLCGSYPPPFSYIEVANDAWKRIRRHKEIE